MSVHFGNSSAAAHRERAAREEDRQARAERVEAEGWDGDGDREAQENTDAKEAEVQDTHRIVAGALFDFMGFLTTREGVIELGASKDASIAVDLIREFAKSRGLDIGSDPLVQTWQDELA